MKAKQTIGVGATAAAAAGMVWVNRTRIARRRELDFERKRMKEAVETFEAEGGLVLS